MKSDELIISSRKLKLVKLFTIGFGVFVAFVHMPPDPALGYLFIPFPVVGLMLYLIFVLRTMKIQDVIPEHIQPFWTVSLSYMFYQIFAFALIYQLEGLKFPDGETPTSSHPYIYFSVITWTSVGYGDITPTNFSRFYAGMEAIFGYIFMGSFLGGFITLASRVKAETISEEAGKTTE